MIRYRPQPVFAFFWSLLPGRPEQPFFHVDGSTVTASTLHARGFSWVEIASLLPK